MFIFGCFPILFPIKNRYNTRRFALYTLAKVQAVRESISREASILIIRKRAQVTRPLAERCVHSVKISELSELRRSQLPRWFEFNIRS